MKSFFQKIINFFSGLFSKKTEALPPPVLEPIPPSRTSPYEWAKSEMGQTEAPGQKNNPRILWYHSFTTLKATEDEVPWCSSFMCAAAESCGYPSTKSASASSWLKYGEPGSGEVGDIVVFKREGGHHVAFVHETPHINDNVIVCLGGNQDNKVGVKMYLKENFLSYRKFPRFDPAIWTPKADWDHLPQAGLWTSLTMKALQDLGKELLSANPEDGASWNSGFSSFSQDQKKAFYVMLLSSMARYESNFKPTERYVENFVDQEGKSVVSRGLLQLSIESVNGYGAGIQKAEELHDPETNLRAAVMILNRWIPKDGVIGNGSNTGAARYWSVIRKLDTRKKIQEKTRALFK